MTSLISLKGESNVTIHLMMNDYISYRPIRFCHLTFSILVICTFSYLSLFQQNVTVENF